MNKSNVYVGINEFGEITQTIQSDHEFYKTQISPHFLKYDGDVEITDLNLANLYFKNNRWNLRADRPSNSKWNFESECWEVDLENLKERKSRDINSACASEITSGFSSKALGEIHFYPNGQVDQINLNSMLLRCNSSYTSTNEVYAVLCANEVNVWDYREHTAAQLNLVSKDSFAFISQARRKNLMLQQILEKATTEEELNSIAW